MVKSARVLVTGVGPVTAIGTGKEEFWSALLRGDSGISRIDRFDTTRFDMHCGGEIKNFRVVDFLNESERRRYGRASQYAIAGLELALQDADLGREDLCSGSTGLCLGTTMADAPAIEAFDDDVAKHGSCNGTSLRRHASQYAASMILVHVARKFRIRGPTFMIPTACAAGNYAIAYATDLIRDGKCNIVIAGGVDPLSRIAFMGFNRILAVAPEKCQPFDLNRKGMMLGEGAGMLVLESESHAAGRGATAYAEIAGYGMSCDAQHMTIPTVRGVSSVMRKALADAGIEASGVDYISAHGTGTVANDRTESAAITEVFGDRARRTATSSIKSMLGHTMGAASALEAISCVLAIRSAVVPPTINFETADPDCGIDCVPNRARHVLVRVALNNSFAFGGNNACVVFRKV